MEDCIFCKISKGAMSTHKLYEDDKFISILDINPVNHGHALLLPKEHYKDLYDLPDELLSEMAPLIKKIAIAVRDSMDAEGINIGMNNGGAAGQLIAHAHIHIIPRFSNDGHRHWHSKHYPEGKAEEVAEQIKKLL